MKELRAILLVGAAVVVMANPGKVREKARQSNSMTYGKETETEMETDSIAGMKLERMLGRMCCESRTCDGCLCNRNFLWSSLEFEEPVEQPVTPGDGDDTESVWNKGDCAACHVARC